jgi:hypothetical protein
VPAESFLVMLEAESLGFVFDIVAVRCVNCGYYLLYVCVKCIDSSEVCLMSSLLWEQAVVPDTCRS